MMHGSLLECGADGKAMNMFQVLQKLEQAEIHTGSPWTLGSGVSVLRNTDGVTIVKVNGLELMYNMGKSGI